jgi:hypothetical protein
MTSERGNIYKGEFKNDKEWGKGTLTWTCGNKMEGEWEDCV